ncbi:MAG: hypothetical protein ABIT01_10315 [Thermoanaerobaculia bacterium]
MRATVMQARQGSFRSLLRVLAAAITLPGLYATPAEAGQLPPVILVPGSPGVELRDARTGALMFPRAKLMFTRHGSDALALPLEHPEETGVVAGALVRRVKVLPGLTLKVDAYGPLLTRLRAQGYREGDWLDPGAGPEVYVFLYDWRQSVEHGARLLFRQMASLHAKQAGGTPRFVLIGHSIGGMLIRYALMYGEAPLGLSGPLPDVSWAGARLTSEAYLVATPNEGAFGALEVVHRGNFYRWGWGAFSPETLFTLPGIFDMIPAHLDPLVDVSGNALGWNLNEGDDWERLGWSVFDPARRRRLSLEQARAHVRSELARKARLLEALDATGPTPNPVVMHLVGSDCRPVLRSAIVSEDATKTRVRFKPIGGPFHERLRALLFEPGDATISARSLAGAGVPHDARTTLHYSSLSLPCASHQKLMSSPLLLDALLPELTRIAQEAEPGEDAR